MYARETYLKIKPDKTNELRKVYQEEVIPEVKAQKGIVDVYLLEPTQKDNSFVSLTVWQDKSYADQYEKSGKYRELVHKFDELYTSEPILKQFNILTKGK